jgi:hypothetical protein
VRSRGLDNLLLLDGTIMEVGEGYWVKIEARQVPPSTARPNGIAYSLCLFNPNDERIVCYDNAHPIAVGNGPAKKQTKTNDHVHKGANVKPYGYSDAETLLVHFWTDVDAALKGARSS